MKDGWYVMVTGRTHYYASGRSLCGLPVSCTTLRRLDEPVNMCTRCIGKLAEGWKRSKRGKVSHYCISGIPVCNQSVRTSSFGPYDLPKCTICARKLGVPVR